MSKNSSSTVFQFKQFSLAQDKCKMKVGTDGILLGAWANTEGVNAVLDIGTGTGLIAIMLAQRIPEAQIHAIEIDDTSFDQAKANMANCAWTDRLTAIHQSIQEYSKSSQMQYDLIVCNPPFFTGGTLSSYQDKNSVRHTTKLAHGDLLTAVRSLLTPEGNFSVILPYIEGLRFKEVAVRYQLYCSHITEVYPKADKQIERLLMRFGKKEIALTKDQLIIQKEKRNDYTDEYVELTKEFYLNM